MSSQQLWDRDSHQRIVYWTGTEWIHPYWIQNPAGHYVFWSPQHQQYLYPIGHPADPNRQGHTVNVPSSGHGKASVTTASTANAATSQAGGFPSSAASLVRGMGSRGIGSSTTPQSDPMLEYRMNEASGVTEYTVTSRTKGVQSKFVKGPAQWITDPSALAQGLTSTKLFKGTGDTSPEAHELLDPSVAKRGVQKSDHAVVHSTREPPANIPTRDEQPSRKEQGMKPQKIRIDMTDRTEALDPMSRINLAKVYTIEHNVKVRDLGMVNRESDGVLWSLFWTVQMEHASKQGPQGMRLYQNAARALTTRPRSDSVAGPSVQDQNDEDEEDKDEDEAESDDGSDEDE
ncbi:hypothetical protein PRZ48_006078 [Zasmidium cellare]|uniref:DUF6590 domain-containing protein n=1 Tax=Zasmidium cellare TaxID=395010 RepID=A0ABR0EM38_ZASCE|nr:hypothetical protein PRZ48_006078 [Zasmidium cellare]